MFRFPETSSGRWHLAIAAAGILVILVWPLTAALSRTDMLLAKGGAASVTAVVCAAGALSGRRLRALPRAVLAAAAVIAAALLLSGHVGASSVCVGDYNGQPVVIGRQLSEDGRRYVAANPGEAPGDHLLAAGGDAYKVWTSDSIAGCRFWVSWGGLTAVPLLALALSSLVWVRGAALSAPPSSSTAAPASSVPAAIRYDAFISYRRLDKARAEALAEALEERGFQVAIDFRDFRPNAHVLTEMERCVLESRFVLCVVTRNYLESGFTTEEARMAALLGAIERRNRVVPLMFERVPLPPSLLGLVGVDFTDAAQIDPMEKLARLLRSARTAPA